MLKALRSKSAGQGQISKTAFLPAPTKGWYVGANLADAPEGTAYILDNAFPQLDYIRMRKGSASYATGMGGSTVVKSLFTWVGPSGSKMFAAGNGKIYDVTSTGAVGAAAVSALTNDYWEPVQMSATGSTSRTIIFNGSDDAQNYDGSAWSTAPAITGLTAKPSFGWNFKNRIYVIEGTTLNAWYLALAAIGGAATKFELGGIFRLGGYLLCGATWSIDSSSGVYETCVFITSEGEVAMYTGEYPGDTAWKLSGLYKVSKPLGKRCLMKAGGDLAIMTEDGIVPMSKVITLDQVALQNAAVTAPIAPAWRQAVIDRMTKTGWQITIWPLESMGVISLPKASDSDKTQFIANVRTGAWARYTGWDANCFCVYNNNLYFGTSDGRVMQAETTGADDGSNYTMTIFPSYSHLGSPGIRKQVRLARPLTQSNFVVTPQLTAKVDFDTNAPLGPTSSPAVGIGSVWGTALWGAGKWGQALTTQSDWKAMPGFGSVVSPVYQVTVSTALSPDLRTTAIQIQYEDANTLG